MALVPIRISVIPTTHNDKPVTGIGVAAFKNCDKLTGVTIPSSIKSIGKEAFFGCSKLTSLTILDSVTSIASSAFEGCNKITVKDNGVHYVDKWVIGADSSITSAIIKEGTRGVADKAFYECSSLTSITIPNSVTSIGSYAFYNCSELTSITIGSGVTSIGVWAFSGCSSLTSVYYGGDAEDWSQISIDSSGNGLSAATLYYYSESNPFVGEGAVESGNYWHYDESGNIAVWAIE